jgi:hypothetical protein
MLRTRVPALSNLSCRSLLALKLPVLRSLALACSFDALLRGF